MLNWKFGIVFIIFGLSLIFLSISTLYSNVPYNNYINVRRDYSSNFTFFQRVPLIFYAFLIIAILSLVFIIFYFRNVYIILISISIFIYCAWILPYLQIGNNFGHDTSLLSRSYVEYSKYGIETLLEFNFVVVGYDSLRYSTALFSTILLMGATNVNLDFALWYLYPLLFISIPFFFYSIFKKFSDKEKNNRVILIIMVVFTAFMPFFIKSGHATGTGVIGVLIFFILVIELFNLMQKNNFNITNSFLIIFLYLFLCLTRTEEAIYFLVLVILYYIYYPFYELKKYDISSSKHLKYHLKEESIVLVQIVKKELRKKQLKKTHFKLGFLLLFLIFIFYFLQEFFGWFYYYLFNTIGKISFLENIYEIYLDTRINISFILRGSIDYSYLIVIIIFFGVFLLSFLIYFLFFTKFNLMNKIYNSGYNNIKKIYNLITKLISNKYFPIIYFPILFYLIIYLELFFLTPVAARGRDLNSIIILIFSYLILILQLFFFSKGITYYKLKNDKQNFFLLAIMASSSMMVFLMIIGQYWLAIYLLHSKFSAFLVFFNLIIIQNTYFKDFKEKKYNYLILLVILVVSLGVFYCLRKLAFG